MQEQSPKMPILPSLLEEKPLTGPITPKSPPEVQKNALERLIKRFGPKNTEQHLRYLDFKFNDVMRRALNGLTQQGREKA